MPEISAASRASPGRRLREAWATRTLPVPGVFNALVARLAQHLGFEAVYLSGAALSAAAGVPDIGLLTLTEFVEEARQITAATTLEDKRAADVAKACDLTARRPS